MIHAALDRVEEELGDGHVRVRADRRGHPHRDRAAGHRDRGRDRRQAAHRPQPQRPGRARPPALRAARRPRADRRASTRSKRCSCGARRRRPRSTCRASPTSSARSRCCSRTTCSRTSGRSARDVDRWRDCLERADVSPLGAGALAGSSLPLDPDVRRARARLPRPRSRTRSTRSPTVTSSPKRCSSATLTQLHLSRIGEEIVLWSTRGVRVRPPRRRVLDRFVDAAAEEEPRHRRARARQGRAG